MLSIRQPSIKHETSIVTQVCLWLLQNLVCYQFFCQRFCMISHPLAKILTFHIFLYISCHSQPPIIPCHQCCCLLLLILKLHLLGHKLFFPSKPTHHLSPLDALMPTFFIFSTTLTTSLSFSFVLFIFSLLFSVPTFQSGLLHSPSAL